MSGVHGGDRPDHATEAGHGDGGKRYTPAPELRARVRRQIAAKPARGGWQWALGLALAAVVVIGLGLAIVLPSRTAARDQLIAGVVDRHVTALASASPVDVVSSDRHTVKPWFAGKLPFTFDLPDLTGSPFTLVAGGWCSSMASPART